MKKLLKKIPYDILVLVAIMLAVVPLGDPHLLQKLKMLFSGSLIKGIDYFDLLMHSTPTILLIVKFAFSFSDSSKNRQA
ncbi:hypothetical protein MNBD_GAMMA12-1437 [hydrothermal vent metagenome]|uniref:RND transporter n=1 Tax=hydrothermal vent metagenome TaxID=652676 RepID=A0A3B0Y7A1_9ZZZZ